MKKTYAGKNILVVGMGLSGIAAANLLKRSGAKVTVTDKKKKQELLPAIKKLSSGIKVIAGYEGVNRRNLGLNSADLLVLSPGVPPDDMLVRLAEKNSIPVTGELEVACSLMSPDARVVAVTGTNGKTTTVELIKSILGQSRSRNSIAAGNIGLPLSACLGRINARTDVVMEVSSYQLETTKDFHPDVSVILNITPDHLEHHGTMAKYIRAKAKIFNRQRKNDFCIINADDVNCMKLTGRLKCGRVLFSRKRKLQKGVYIHKDKLVCDTGFSPVAEYALSRDLIKIPGPHNLENVMAGVAVGSIFGLSQAAIRRAISSFRGVEHRIEDAGIAGGVRFINDSKSTNVQSCLTALATFDKNIVLIMGGRDKGTPYQPLRKPVHSKVNTLIVIGEAAERIEKELRGTTTIFMVSDVKQAVGLAFSLSGQGSTVLFSPACSSFDQFKNFEERGRVFKKWVKRLP